MTPLLRLAAIETGMLDRPSVHKIHTGSVPYLGGIALILGLIAGLMSGPVPGMGTLVLGCAALALSVVGLIDDRFMISIASRIVVQSAAAVIAVLVGVRVVVTGTPWIDVVLTLLWIVAITNAMNLVDNMDGQAAGYVVVGALGVLAMSALSSQSLVAALSGALAGSSAGFLLWNLSKWRIFLGDAGSLFLGFALAVAVIEVSPTRLAASSGRAVALLLVAMPLLDLATVVTGRWRHDRRFWRGGADHLAHRLVARGMGERGAVGLLVGCQGVLVLIAVGMAETAVPVGVGVGAGSVLVAMMARVAWSAEVYPDTGPLSPIRIWISRAVLIAAIGTLYGVVALGSAASSEPAALVSGSHSSQNGAFGLFATLIGLVIAATVTVAWLGRAKWQ